MAQTGLIQNALPKEDELNPQQTGLNPNQGSTSSTPTTNTNTAGSSPTGTGAPGSSAVPPPAGYTPQLSTLNPDTETVAGRFNNLTKQDSPLMEQARTNVAQQFNARGLLNSSMAAGEGEKAAYAAALPIAQQDANAALTVSQRNQADTNQALQFGATSQNQFGMQQLQGQQALQQQQLRGDQANELERIQDGNKILLQSSQSASQFFSQISTSISDILKEPSIPVDQKQQLVQKQIDLLKNGLGVIGGISNLDLGGLLNFSALAPAPAPEQKPANSDLTPDEVSRLRTILNNQNGGG